jgi:hypothetical protein
LRVLASGQGTPQARRDLAIAISELGSLTDELEGPAAAEPFRVEAEALLSTIASK